MAIITSGFASVVATRRFLHLLLLIVSSLNWWFASIIESQPIPVTQKFLRTKTVFETPRLAACTDYEIVAQDLNRSLPLLVLHELDDTETVFASFDFDYRNKQLFYSTYHELFHKDLKTAKVQKIYPNENRTTFDAYRMVQLSYDWLNQYLYFLADFNNKKTYQIHRLIDWRRNNDDDAADHQLIFSTNNSRIQHFQVDPYNGYIFWTDASGMNRIVLGSDADNLIDHSIIYSDRDGQLGAFAIDYIAFRAFLINNLQDHLISLTLNGENVEMLRLDVVTATYTRAPSLVWLNNQLYWSDNYALVEEYYNNKTEKYEHKRFEIKCKTCVTSFNYVLGFSSLRQPIPYPQKAPANFTVIADTMTQTSIDLMWSQPEPINDHKSKAAWNKYLYKIQYTNMNDSWTYEKNAIEELSVRLDNLRENCFYEIELSAFVSDPISIGISDPMRPEESRWSLKLWARTKSQTEIDAVATIAKAAAAVTANVITKQTANQQLFDDLSLRPRKITVEHLVPGEIRLKWLPSSKTKRGERTWYEIYWVRANATEIQSKSDYTVGYERDFYVSDLNLTANETYTVWVRAHGFNKKIVSDSSRVTIKTLAEPHSLQLLNRTSRSLELEWKKGPEIIDYKLEYYQKEKWLEIEPKTVTKELVRFVILNLEPDTKYEMRLQLKYSNAIDYRRCSFETLPGRPSRLAQSPLVLRTGDRSYSIRWHAAPETAADGSHADLQRVRSYVVECWDATNYTPFRSIVCCNTTALECDVTTNVSHDHSKYIFRVAAVNAYGCGEFTNFTKADWIASTNEYRDLEIKDGRRERSELVDFVQSNRNGSSSINDYLVEILLAALVFGFVFFLILLLVYKNRSCTNKETSSCLVNYSAATTATATIVARDGRESQPDHEQLSSDIYDDGRLIFASRSKFYEQLPSPRAQDIRQLPQFGIDDFEMIKLMGQGAFGDVYIGKTKENRNIAVKTLRSNHNLNEREKFLKEAVLMSNFRHKNVLKFLGICIASDKSFILMELMENGDLLTFLRDSRCTRNYEHWLWTYGTTLTIPELLTMCIQIAMGCEYLARKQYVHRDLACRNCLIAIRDTQILVKIGDFGLSRPIKTKSYYRVHSETLLPVRWMAPESLIDYRFSSASDVWSFGIVLWEIFSLGQEPYATLTSADVVTFVRAGNVSKAPPNCPSTVYDLMLKCWKFNPDDRIGFKQSVIELRRIKKLITGVSYVNVTDGSVRNEYMDILPAIGSNGSGAGSPQTSLLTTAIVNDDDNDGCDETVTLSIDNQAYVFNNGQTAQVRQMATPSPSSTLPVISEEDLSDDYIPTYTQTDL